MSISDEVKAPSDLELTKTTRSVPSCGIEVNSIEAAAEAKVLDSISFIF
jgi:hypothetical protein